VENTFTKPNVIVYCGVWKYLRPEKIMADRIIFLRLSRLQVLTALIALVLRSRTSCAVCGADTLLCWVDRVVIGYRVRCLAPCFLYYLHLTVVSLHHDNWVSEVSEHWNGCLHRITKQNTKIRLFSEHYATSRKGAGSRPNEVNFSTYLILPVALGPVVYPGSNRNEYQKHRNNNVSGEWSAAGA
jgi:hypothetical protein